MLSPYVTGYAVISLPKLAAELRAQGMTVTCLPLLGSKWLKGLRLLLACFVVPYMLLRFRIRTVQVNGLARLDESWVRRRIKWTEGAPFDQSQVEATRQAMVSSALFGTVSVAPNGPVGPDGTVPMQIYVIERALRSVSVGGSYDTTEGISANVSWEHRDLFGGGEDLKFTATGGTSDNSLSTIFRLPDVWASNQDFVASLILDDQNYNAYDSIEQKGEVGFERHFDPTLSGGVSLEAEHARVNEKVDYRTYVLVGTPVFLKKDGTDDLLNPTRGYRFAVETTPYLRALGSNLTFLQTKLTSSWYFFVGSWSALITVEAVTGINPSGTGFVAPSASAQSS